MKYRFTNTHRTGYLVSRICRVLGGTRSGYYTWWKRPVSEREKRNTQRLLHIHAVYQESRGTDGSRRLHQELREQGVICSRQRPACLRRQDGLWTIQHQFYKQTVRPNPRLPVAPNLLNQDFTAQRPNQQWLADFTYIVTVPGRMYLTTVIDVFSHQTLRWSMSERQQCALIEDALQMALTRHYPQAELLHHSNR